MIRTLEFTRDASHLVVARPEGLELRDLRTASATTDLAVDGLHAFTMLGDELWVTAGTPVTLARFRVRDGDAIVGPMKLPAPGPEPRLTRGYGASHVTWNSDLPVRVTRRGDDLIAGTLATRELTLALGATRAVSCTSQGVTLRDGTVTRWTIRLPHHGTAIDGEVLFDGRVVALVLESVADRVLVVVATRDGAIHHRIKLPRDCQIRFAVKRGAAIVSSLRRRLILIDLRYGRVELDRELSRDIADLAIDDAGQRIALRFDDRFGEVVELGVRDLAAYADTAVAPLIEPELHALAPEPRLVPSEAPPRSERSSDATRVDPFASSSVLERVGGLPTRPARASTTAEETRAGLDAERQRIAALTARAIAGAWDRGLIAFPDPGAAPFRSEVEGVAGAVTGEAAAEVVASERRLEAATRRVAEIAEAVAPRWTPLAELAAELGLSPLACEILLVVAAPLLWGELARLYGILANDANRALCDELLVTQLLAARATPYQIAAELDPTAPLVRSGIVRAGAGPARPFLPLVIDRIGLVRLRGTSPLGELASVMRPVGTTPRFAELRIRAAVKDRAVIELAEAREPLRVAVTGKPGSGRRSLLAAIAEATGRRLGIVDVAALPRDPVALADALRIALEQTHLAGFVPCVDGLDRIDRTVRQSVELVRDVLRSHPGPLTVRLGRGAEVPLDPGYVAIELPPTTIGERVTAWTASTAAAGLAEVDTATLSDRYRIGPGLIERVTREVLARPGAGELVDDRLDREIRGHLSHDLGAIADRVERRATWSQVILPSDIQDSLTELIGRIRHRRTVFEAWGFDRVMTSARGVTALFQGGPGTGKSLVAGAIANELGVDLYRIDVSRVMSKWIGETEQNLARLFDAAEDANAVLLFDEADSLFAKRTEVKSSVDRYANLEVNYLLQRLDSFEGIAILTTNLGGSIDAAFKRRLSFRLTFPFPDEEQRELLWRAHLPPETPRCGELDLPELARRYQLSGGYIRNCALRAAFLAAEEGSGLGMNHLERAIKAEYREIGKLGEGGVLQ